MSTAGFAFPLNVYACMLERAEGRLDYLHYGWFERDDEPVWQAQERASQALWRVLPPPCRVLEVGIGVGTTLRRLGEAGYRAFGITPDAAQIAEVRRRHGDAVTVLQSTLESLPRAQGPWDLMLLQESAQYIEPLALFEAADRLLAPGDEQLIVVDEFTLQRRGPLDTGLHDWSAFVALAQRMGWTVRHEQDLSAGAAHTLTAIDRLVRSQRQALQHELSLPPEQLDQLLESTARYRQRYRDGVYGYRLLALQRARRPALRLGAVNADRSPEMRGLFAAVFGHPMSASEWQWKYGQGRGHAVGLWQGDDLVAHYGGVTRPVIVDGAVRPCCQVGDVMVLKQANAGLGRQGALQQVSATLLEAQIGWGKPHLLGFGFPNRRAMRVAERLGLYAAVDEVIQLDWAALPARSWRDAAWRCDEIDAASLAEGTATWLELQQLWQTMVRAMPRTLLPQRDPRWLWHRYGRRPGVEYRVLMQRRRWGGAPLGVLVLRVHDDHVELIDLVGDPAGFPRLVRSARQVCARAGRPLLRTWITASHADRLDDPRDPATRVAIGVQVPSCAHTAGPAADELRGRWFLMPGDTDFR